MHAPENIVIDLYLKLAIEDFINIPDDQLKETFYRMKSNLLEQRGWDHDLLTLIYQVKRRRHPHYFFGYVAVGISQFSNYCLKVSKTVGLRRQIHFYYRPHSHGLGFDIKNVNGKLSIIAFDSVRMPMFLDTLKEIKISLVEKSIEHDIYACQTRIQSDELNCQPFTYILLSQLAQSMQIHDALISVEKIQQPQFYDSNTKQLCDYPEQVADIKWIDVKHFPEKILLMTQSYFVIARMLEDRNHKGSQEITEKFKKTIAPMKEFIQNNPSYTAEQCPKNNYITTRRQHIAAFFSDRLYLSIIAYRQQFNIDCQKLSEMLRNRSTQKMDDEIERFFTLIHYPAKYKIEIIEEIAQLIRFKPEQIYEKFFIKPKIFWCLEQVEDLFTFRKIMLKLLKNNQGSKILDQKFKIVDECLPILLDFTDDNGINCFRHDLITGSQLTDRNHALLYKLISVYGVELVSELSTKPYTGSMFGIIFYIQLIAKLEQSDLEELLTTYPNAVSIQNNWDDIRKFLGIKIYDDDAVTVYADDTVTVNVDDNNFNYLDDMKSFYDDEFAVNDSKSEPEKLSQNSNIQQSITQIIMP